VVTEPVAKGAGLRVVEEGGGYRVETLS